MSRAREVVGVDAKGRPIARWADAPELDQPLPANPPGPIERRRVEPVAIDSAREQFVARRIGGVYQPTPAERRRSAANSVAARKPAQEDPMDDVVVPTPLEELATAARAAHDAREELVVAEEAWAKARDRLTAAWTVVHDEVEDPVPPDHLPAQSIELDDGTVMRAHSDGQPETIAAIRELGTAAVERLRREEPAPKRQPGHHPSKAGEAKEKAERAAKVVAAMKRLDGNVQAVALSLGMRPNAVVMVVKHARLRGELP